MVPAARLRPVVACTSPRTVELAAERGLPMLLGMHIGDADKADMIRAYGREDPGHVAAVVGHVGDSTAQAVRELKETMPRWLGPGLAGYVPVDGRARSDRDISGYVDFLCDTHPVGSPDHCVEKINRTAEITGLRHLILMVEGAGDHARTLGESRRLGAEVLPRIRGRALLPGISLNPGRAPEPDPGRAPGRCVPGPLPRLVVMPPGSCFRARTRRAPRGA